MMARLALAWCLRLVLIGVSAGAASVRSYAADCDTTPTGIETQDYRLYFVVPPGLMPDPQFDGRPAGLEMHRVRPVYAVRCQDVPSRVAVLIHGRVVSVGVGGNRHVRTEPARLRPIDHIRDRHG
jgi:hypothetical protein